MKRIALLSLAALFALSPVFSHAAESTDSHTSEALGLRFEISGEGSASESGGAAEQTRTNAITYYPDSNTVINLIVIENESDTYSLEEGEDGALTDALAQLFGDMPYEAERVENAENGLEYLAINVDAGNAQMRMYPLGNMLYIQAISGISAALSDAEIQYFEDFVGSVEYLGTGLLASFPMGQE